MLKLIISETIGCHQGLIPLNSSKQKLYQKSASSRNLTIPRDGKVQEDRVFQIKIQYKMAELENSSGRKGLLEIM